MLGHRGCRLAVTYPEIAEMQAEAIITTAGQRGDHGPARLMAMRTIVYPARAKKADRPSPNGRNSAKGISEAIMKGHAAL